MVESVGDAYDSALAETTINLYKTELIRVEGRRQDLDQIEAATSEWVPWDNSDRTHEAGDDFTRFAAEELRWRACIHHRRQGRFPWMPMMASRLASAAQHCGSPAIPLLVQPRLTGTAPRVQAGGGSSQRRCSQSPCNCSRRHSTALGEIWLWWARAA